MATFSQYFGVGGWSLCLDRLEGYVTLCSGETQSRFKSQDQVMRLAGVKLWHEPQLLLGICAFTLTKLSRTCLHGKNTATSSTPQNFSMWPVRKLILKSCLIPESFSQEQLKVAFITKKVINGEITHFITDYHIGWNSWFLLIQEDV